MAEGKAVWEVVGVTTNPRRFLVLCPVCLAVVPSLRRDDHAQVCWPKVS